MRLLCRVSEFLKFSRSVCCLLSILLMMSAAAALYVRFAIESDSPPVFLTEALGRDKTSLALVNFGAEMVFPVATTLLGILLGYVMSACPQRKAVIDALASGYVANFLVELNRSARPLLIVKPGHEVVEKGRASGLQVLTDAKWVARLKEAGFKGRIAEVTVEGRTVQIAEGNSPPRQLMLDFSRNLSALRDIANAEGQTWFDRLCPLEAKYEIFKSKYFAKVEEEIPSLPHPSCVSFVDGAKAEDVVSEINRQLGL